MLRFGVVTAALSMLALTFASSLSEFITARFLLGLGEGAFFPAARRVAIARDPKRAGEFLGLLTAFQLAGFVMGPSLASGLNEFLGLQATFGVLAALVAVSAPLVARVEVPSGATTVQRRVVRNLLRRRPMQAMLCASVGVYGGFGMLEAIWAVYLSDLGASQLAIGAALSAFAVPMIFITPYAGRLAGRIGGMRLAFIGVAASIPCIALYGLFNALIPLVIVMVLHGVADAFVMPAGQLAVADAAPDQLASGQGLFSGVGLGAAALTAVGSGAVYQQLGPAVLFVGWAVVTAVCLGFAAYLGREALRPGSRRSVSAEASSPSL